MENNKIGFIGQGYIGKNYADDFENRGYTVVRYSLEEPHVNNNGKIAGCDMVFVAVPTPTTPEGFDGGIVREALKSVGKGKIAVIKSTILPGITRRLQQEYPDIIVLNSPEFLSEATAAHDAAHPSQNIIGLPIDDEPHRDAAVKVLSVLPNAPTELVMKSEEAELFKYAHNLSGYVQVVLFNILYDTAEKLDCSWEPIQKAVESDPLISNRYARPVHKTGRGAGGHCFIKDFEAFSKLYKELASDEIGHLLLDAMKKKNLDLLLGSGKDLDLIRQVYGDEIIDTHTKGR